MKLLGLIVAMGLCAAEPLDNSLKCEVCKSQLSSIRSNSFLTDLVASSEVVSNNNLQAWCESLMMCKPNHSEDKDSNPFRIFKRQNSSSRRQSKHHNTRGSRSHQPRYQNRNSYSKQRNNYGVPTSRPSRYQHSNTHDKLRNKKYNKNGRGTMHQNTSKQPRPQNINNHGKSKNSNTNGKGRGSMHQNTSRQPRQQNINNHGKPRTSKTNGKGRGAMHQSTSKQPRQQNRNRNPNDKPNNISNNKGPGILHHVKTFGCTICPSCC